MFISKAIRPNLLRVTKCLVSSMLRYILRVDRFTTTPKEANLYKISTTGTGNKKTSTDALSLKKYTIMSSNRKVAKYLVTVVPWLLRRHVFELFNVFNVKVDRTVLSSNPLL